jgi:ABC-2 type transport system ATP-binding protein
MAQSYIEHNDLNPNWVKNIMILEIAHITKNYGQTAAVDDVSFSIQEGTCFGLLGPNGAGKTTTIEIIEGIRNPDSGKILYNGAPRDAKFKEDIGIQFQSTSLLAFLTVRETLKTFQTHVGHIYGQKS